MWIGVQKLFDFVDPRIQVERVRQSLEFSISRAEVLVELDIEQFEEVGSFVCQGAVDLDKARLGLIEE